LWTW